MTSKEAVDLFKQYYWKVEDKEKALEILEELAERDTPMKLKSHNNGKSYCGVCGKSKQHDYGGNENVFCGGCGQRIDWK